MIVGRFVFVFFLSKGSPTTEFLKQFFLYASPMPFSIAFLILPFTRKSWPTLIYTTAIPVSWHMASFFFFAIKAFFIITSRTYFAFGFFSFFLADLRPSSTSFRRDVFAFTKRPSTTSCIILELISLLILPLLSYESVVSI